MRVLLVVALASCADQAPAPPPSDPAAIAASQILATTLAMYRGLHGYIDHGYRTLTTHGERYLSTTFETSFERSARFRFEFRDHGDAQRAYTITMDDTGVQRRWYGHQNEIESEPNLDYALGVAAGVSGGTTCLVPPMLDAAPNTTSWLAVLSDAKLEGSEVIDGHSCWRIQAGMHLSGTKLTVWIDRDSYAVRRVVEDMKLKPPDHDPYDAQAVTFYEPILNPPTI